MSSSANPSQIFIPIVTADAPEAIGTYSQAATTTATHTTYLSGQIPLDAKTMDLVSEDFASQAHQVFKNLRAVTQASGGDLANCVKLTIYLTDLSNFAIVNEVMASFFSTPYPARAAVQISALPRGAQIEIDGIMVQHIDTKSQ